jgi:hypothetical protein
MLGHGRWTVNDGVGQRGGDVARVLQLLWRI